MIQNTNVAPRVHKAVLFVEDPKVSHWIQIFLYLHLKDRDFLNKPYVKYIHYNINVVMLMI